MVTAPSNGHGFILSFPNASINRILYLDYVSNLEKFQYKLRAIFQTIILSGNFKTEIIKWLKTVQSEIMRQK